MGASSVKHGAKIAAGDFPNTTSAVDELTA